MAGGESHGAKRARGIVSVPHWSWGSALGHVGLSSSPGGFPAGVGRPWYSVTHAPHDCVVADTRVPNAWIWSHDRHLEDCDACGRTRGQFFVIRSEDSPSSAALVEKVQQDYLKRLSLNKNNQQHTLFLLAQAVRLRGVSVCLPCASPILGALHRAKCLDNSVPEPISARGRVLRPVAPMHYLRTHAGQGMADRQDGWQTGGRGTPRLVLLRQYSRRGRNLFGKGGD